MKIIRFPFYHERIQKLIHLINFRKQCIYRKDLNIKNKVYINTIKVIHKQLKQICPILYDFSYYINSYQCLRLKIEKTFYNGNDFPAFLGSGHYLWGGGLVSGENKD